MKAVNNVKGNGDFPNMPLISLASEKAGRGRGPGTGEGGFLPRSLASPSPELLLDKFGVVGIRA